MSIIRSIGKNLVVLSLCLMVLDHIHFKVINLYYEPAGNPVQLIWFGLPIWFRHEVMPFVSQILSRQPLLFWLGVALLWAGRSNRE